MVLVAEKCFYLESARKLQYWTKDYEGKELVRTVAVDYWLTKAVLAQNDDVGLEYCHCYLPY